MVRDEPVERAFSWGVGRGEAGHPDKVCGKDPVNSPGHIRPRRSSLPTCRNGGEDGARVAAP